MTHPVHSLPPEALESLFDEAFEGAQYGAALTVFCEAALAIARDNEDVKVSELASGLGIILENIPRSVSAIANVKAGNILSLVNGGL